MGNQESTGATSDELDISELDNAHDLGDEDGNGKNLEVKIEYEDLLKYIRSLKLEGLSEKLLQSSLKSLDIESHALDRDEVKALVTLLKYVATGKADKFKSRRWKSITSHDRCWIRKEVASTESTIKRDVGTLSPTRDSKVSVKTKKDRTGSTIRRDVGTLSPTRDSKVSVKTKKNRTGSTIQRDVGTLPPTRDSKVSFETNKKIFESDQEKQRTASSKARRNSLKNVQWVNNKREYTEDELKEIGIRNAQDGVNTNGSSPPKTPPPKTRKSVTEEDTSWINNSGLDQPTMNVKSTKMTGPSIEPTGRSKAPTTQPKGMIQKAQSVAVQGPPAPIPQRRESVDILHDKCWINNKIEYTDDQLAEMEKLRESSISPSNKLNSKDAQPTVLIKDDTKKKNTSPARNAPSNDENVTKRYEQLYEQIDTEVNARQKSLYSTSSSLDDECWINNKIEYTDDQLAEMERLRKSSISPSEKLNGMDAQALIKDDAKNQNRSPARNAPLNDEIVAESYEKLDEQIDTEVNARKKYTPSASSSLDDQCWVNNKIEYTEEELAAIDKARTDKLKELSSTNKPEVVEIFKPKNAQSSDSNTQSFIVTGEVPASSVKNMIALVDPELEDEYMHQELAQNTKISDNTREAIETTGSFSDPLSPSYSTKNALDDQIWIEPRVHPKQCFRTSISGSPLSFGEVGKQDVDDTTETLPMTEEQVLTPDDQSRNEPKDAFSGRGITQNDVDISGEVVGDIKITDDAHEAIDTTGSLPDPSSSSYSIKNALDDQIWIEPRTHPKQCFRTSISGRSSSVDEDDAQDVDDTTETLPMTKEQARTSDDESSTQPTDEFSDQVVTQNDVKVGFIRSNLGSDSVDTQDEYDTKEALTTTKEHVHTPDDQSRTGPMDELSDKFVTKDTFEVTDEVYGNDIADGINVHKFLDAKEPSSFSAANTIPGDSQRWNPPNHDSFQSITDREELLISLPSSVIQNEAGLSVLKVDVPDIANTKRSLSPSIECKQALEWILSEIVLTSKEEAQDSGDSSNCLLEKTEDRSLVEVKVDFCDEELIKDVGKSHDEEVDEGENSYLNESSTPEEGNVSIGLSEGLLGEDKPSVEQHDRTENGDAKEDDRFTDSTQTEERGSTLSQEDAFWKAAATEIVQARVRQYLTMKAVKKMRLQLQSDDQTDPSL